MDSVAGNNGVFVNGVSFVPGEVGQAFNFTTVSSGVGLGNPPDLQLQNFTLEVWIKRGSATRSSWDVYGFAHVLGAAWGGYGIGLNDSGNIFLSKIGYSNVFSTNSVTDTNAFHHIVVTKSGSNVVFYIDGVPETSAPYDPGFVFNGTFAIGARGSDYAATFLGAVDEASIYNRALTAPEVEALHQAGQAGKCAGLFAPLIFTQPSDQKTFVDDTVTFTVAAGGSIPLSYQWQFNQSPIPDATNTSLTLSNVTLNSAGSYAVVVTNVAGSITSSPAILTVTLPPASIQVAAATVTSDGTVTVPVNLVANGNENALGFSLNFSPTLLTNTGVVLGDGASGASLFPNLLHAASGQIGVAVGLPSGKTFSPGTQQVVMVSFVSPIVTTTTSTPISFVNSPITNQLVDVSGTPLSATFVPGSVLLPPSELEGDAFPRPNGDSALTVSDWVLIGRYVARLDSPTNAIEFQKADCAPRDTLGDGALTVSDWVQAGRYVAGLDPATRVGGPTSEVPAVVPAAASSSATRRTVSNPRQIRLSASALVQGQTGIVEVDLDAQGDENALAFSLSFDPAKLTFVGASAGEAATGAILNINANQASQGRLGCVLALKANQSFAAGSKQVVKVSFRAAGANGNAVVSFGDQPVPRGVSAANASALSADYVNGAVAVNSLPALRIVASAQNISLSWPASATGFTLQESSGSRMATTSWTTVASTPVVINNQNVVSVPASASAKFYRLSQ